ncbi:DUF3237 domain-containing protein [Sphingomonas sp. BIUV-7]|uniref:DUF3237 domain-containing protein n=1 Tax=Sphingomonas natans TaxID=3063330 RepID=A0ABT8Y7Z8_9SPHN|nr:DUF3237 domain-containing protein [Sphingomonas sp. BIUV-7]MDO6414457.1 DUF3237 domain-containing protein [Sphingomonas sp. BIUV-7]
MLDLKLLCTAIVEVAPPLLVGKAPAGTRTVGELRSVTMSGERIKATLAGVAAADWIRLNGRVGDIDVRMTVRTDDDALIYIHYTGKLDLGRPGGPVATVAPTFETGDARYAWLNDIQAIGRATLTVGEGGAARLDYELYEVL